MAQKRETRPALDRFGTHSRFIRDHLARLAGGAHGSPVAANLWFVLWDMADAETGCVLRRVTVSYLAVVTGASRQTMRLAIARLCDEGLLVVEGGRFFVPHLERAG